MYLRTGPLRVIFSNMTMIDNIYGFGPSMSAKGKSGAGDKDDMSTEMNDNKIYGESPIPDCPPNGGYCY